ncbi:MAG: DoxX family membrane protein [Actinomycetota bacterium]|nr:DoxX family membrane protein [Actinomycetota bacterium]MEE3125891.1 DoxX family membrane protein [Actinomycetota bacterium]
MSISRTIARPLLASTFFIGATNALKHSDAMAQKAESVTDKLVPVLQKAVPALPQDPQTLVRINAGVQLTAALGLATGRAPRTCATVLAASLVPTTVAGHRFWEADDDASAQQQRLHFAKNLSLLGGLVIAAGDTDGKPGVAWRTRHLARTAKREARREAKLVSARVR